eukprot:CAMPEP_0203810246 /NCGR_PEP_ID=MMETSP0115-20131106/2821_1 /ASSEMBLY_ACC=CAM_ASM_000227 /TAXON_ID=33651 /ORGANISM="Bicosoecid sp, Strain ms1" /LENGTH=584 /DNA_ID=CAMNT_0050719031 /DNA_START=19 /DNA_END=1774 /DNA_ORIENTATION=+
MQRIATSVSAAARGARAVRAAGVGPIAAARVAAASFASVAGDAAARTPLTGPSDAYRAGVDKLDAKKANVTAHVSIADDDAKNAATECPFVAAADPALVRASQRESNARSYVRKFPMVIAEADGVTLTDTDGRVYLDCLGCAGTLALGHNHPVVKEALLSYIGGPTPKPLQVLDMASVEKDHFVTKLFEVLPDNLSRVHFCSPAGTDALDAAVKMCKIATGRRTVLAFAGGYHGHGHGTLAMMGNLGAKTPVSGLMPDVHFLPFPYNYRHPFGMEGEEGETAVIRAWEAMLGDDESGVPKPACVVVEAIQGEGGVHPMSPRALRELRRITREHDIPLVIDEVQAGFCRSGDFFAFEHGDIQPDVVCMSKALGGGQPLAVIAFTEELNKWGPAAHTGTFRGSQLSFVAGAASIGYMQETKLWEHAAARGEQLRKRMTELQAASDVGCIGDIRGRGLMQGVELVRDHADEVDASGRPMPDGALAGRTQVECFKRGMLLERGGRGGAVMRMLPPLVIQEAQIDQACDIFAEALRAAIAMAASECGRATAHREPAAAPDKDDIIIAVARSRHRRSRGAGIRKLVRASL